MKSLKDTESSPCFFMCQLFLESVRTNLLRDVAARASTCLYESVCHADDWPIGHETDRAWNRSGTAWQMMSWLVILTINKLQMELAITKIPKYHQISQMQTLRLHASNSPRMFWPNFLGEALNGLWSRVVACLNAKALRHATILW